MSFGVTSEQFVQFLFSGITQGAVLAIIALGFSMIYGTTKLVNFAQGHFVLLGGILAWVFVERAGWPTLPAVLSAGVVVALIAAATYGGLLRYARSKVRLSQAMITIALGLFIDALILLSVGVEPVYFNSFSGDEPVRLLGASFARQGLWVIGLAALIMLVLRWFYSRTTVGQAMLACSMNAEAAALMGVNTGVMIGLSWALSGLIGAIGGASVTPMIGAAYGSGLAFALRGFTATVVGGLGSQTGAVLGGLTIGMVSAMVTGFTNATVADFVTFLVLLLVLVLRPKGLLGRVETSGLEEVEAAGDGSAATRSSHSSIWPLAALCSAVVAYAVLLPDGRFVTFGTNVGVYTILALGLSMLASFAGQLSLAQGAFGAIGGYSLALIAVKAGLPYYFGIALAVILPTALAFGLGHFLLRLRSFYMAMGTLAFAGIVDRLILTLDWTGGFSGISGIYAPRLGPLDLGSLRGLYWFVWLVAALCIIATLLILRTRAGRELSGLRTDPVVTSLLGHDVAYWKRGAFALSGLFGGIGGLLLAYSTTTVTPYLYASQMSILLFVMLVVGGWRSIWGAPLGALIVTGLPLWLERSDRYADLIYTVLVLLVLVVLPKGVAGVLADLPSQIARGVRRGARSSEHRGSHAGRSEAATGEEGVASSVGGTN